MLTFELTVITLLHFICRTPLMLAVANGHVEAVLQLVEMGANIQAMDVYCRTALHRGVTLLL